MNVFRVHHLSPHPVIRKEAGQSEVALHVVEGPLKALAMKAALPTACVVGVLPNAEVGRSVRGPTSHGNRYRILIELP